MVCIRKKVKISSLPTGMIIWKKGRIIGVTGYGLNRLYLNRYVISIPGNAFDYELIG